MERLIYNFAFKVSHFTELHYMTLADLKNKYPFIRYLTSFKFWGIVFGLGLLAQIVLIVKFNSFVFFSGMLFLGIIWYVIALIFRRASGKTRLIIHSVFFAIMLIEICLRLSGLQASYTEKRFGYHRVSNRHQNNEYWIKPNNPSENLESIEFSYDRKVNSLGYRDKEWKWEDMKDKTRILALGDSFTEGDGAHNDSTWLKFFERKLNDTSCYFMNAGLCGSDPVFDAYKLIHTFSKFKPDYVIACINRTDIEDVILRGGFERYDGNAVEFKKGPWWQPFYGVSHVLRLFFNVHYNELFIKKSNMDEYQDNAFAVIQQAMDSIQSYCQNHSSKPVFVFHPTSMDVYLDNNCFDRVTDSLHVDDPVIIDLFDYYQ
nr:SGNH/GDSL hydrolase family protein [Candidatus Delongbacteria bacterium]